jgi:uncharacterized protein YjbI with pentapeptide repeats
VAEGFTCGVAKEYRSACAGGQYRDTGYCVLHEPNEAKDKKEFEKVREDKLARKDYDFSGTVFPEGTADFEGREFDANTHFSGATFLGGAYFRVAKFSCYSTEFSRTQFSGRTSFSGAQFSGRTSFSGARFSGWRTSFRGAKFSGEMTDFSGAWFSGEWTDFSGAKFSGEMTDFSEAEFASSGGTRFEESTTFEKMVLFNNAAFKEKVVFGGITANPVFGPQAQAQFDGLEIEKPALLKFNTVVLRPGWFINAPNVRNVDFTDVEWAGISDKPEDFKHSIRNLKGRVRAATEALKKRELRQAWHKLTVNALDNEIETLKEREAVGLKYPISPYTLPHTILAQACRRLSAKAEEDREYPLANEFHYWSMDALRKKGWRSLGFIGIFYWALSGYGVRAARAFSVLVAICAAFALLYMVLGPPKLQDLGQAVVYSLGAIARLNPEPRPTEPGLFQLLVTAEGILGPLQIALLALAVRRQVMR